jgi:hypothetical protein
MDKGMIFAELDDAEEIQLPWKTTINNTEETYIGIHIQCVENKKGR